MTALRKAGVAMALTTLLFAGCGDDDDEGTSTEEPAPFQVSANNATQEELMTIPGVGEQIAHEIDEYRPYDAETGPAKFRDELSKYISDEEIDKILPYLDFSE